jgi:hypothetical protein
MSWGADECRVHVETGQWSDFEPLAFGLPWHFWQVPEMTWVPTPTAGPHSLAAAPPRRKTRRAAATHCQN